MSYDDLRAIRDSGLTSTQRLVAWAVALRAGEDGCWASVPTLAADTGLAERTVQVTLRALVGLGALVEQRRVRGARWNDTTVYRVGVILPREVVQQVREVVQDDHHPGAGGSPGVVQEDHQSGDRGAPKEPSDQPSVISPPTSPVEHETRAPDPEPVAALVPVRPGLPDALLEVAHGYLAGAGLLRGLMSPIPPRDLAALTGAHRDGVTPQDVALLAEWVGASADDDARWLRERRHGWAAILSPGRARVRIDAARAWQARGRTEILPTTSRPRPGVALSELFDDLTPAIEYIDV